MRGFRSSPAIDRTNFSFLKAIEHIFKLKSCVANCSSGLLFPTDFSQEIMNHPCNVSFSPSVKKVNGVRALNGGTQLTRGLISTCRFQLMLAIPIFGRFAIYNISAGLCIGVWSSSCA